MTVTVRPAAEADLPAIQKIYEHAVLHGTATFEIEPPDVVEMRRRWLALTGAGCPYLVAVIDGQVAGYAYAGPYRPRPAYRYTVEDSVYIDPDRQGRGAGRALLAALISAAEAAGFRQMISVIGDSENTASRRLHAAHRFHEVGIVRAVGWKHGRWLDTVYMQRALGPGDGTAP